jgi:hypothetical protein
LLFTVWFLAASWSAAHALAGRDSAWLAVTTLLIVVGSYGASRVFQFADVFLTARLPAEALIVTSLSLYLRGWKGLGFVISTATMFLHPLIALPGLLLLMSLEVPIRVSIAGAIAGILLALAIAMGAANISAVSHVLPLMDSAWLNIVQERSQFLFLQLWSFRDWDLNARPFFYLAFTAMAVQDGRIRKLCIAAAVVGVAGLSIALVASLLGPVALLVQGQAWRWVWISTFIAILLLPATVLGVWRDEKCGPLCAILLVSGWTLPVDGTACVSLALMLWIMRESFGARFAAYSRWLAVALSIAIIVWILVESRRIFVSANPTLTQIREFFGLKATAAIFAALLWRWLRMSRSAWMPTLAAGALFAASLFLVPAAFKQSNTLGAAADIDAFADWRSVIPQTSTVLVVPPRDVGAFVWFTLKRPNYLALDQSAGVVFSRATAMEVQRRSDVLLPVMDPQWKILTNLRAGVVAGHPVNPAMRPLTTKSLAQICRDSVLGFVVSSQNVGLNSLRQGAGARKDWSLYDCRQVREQVPEG